MEFLGPVKRFVFDYNNIPAYTNIQEWREYALNNHYFIDIKPTRLNNIRLSLEYPESNYDAKVLVIFMKHLSSIQSQYLTLSQNTEFKSDFNLIEDSNF